MNYYKLEATHNVIPIGAISGKVKKTYKYFFNSFDSMLLRLENELKLGGIVKVKKISESAYTQETHNG